MSTPAGQHRKAAFLGARRVGSRVRVRSELLDATKVAEDIVNLTVRNTDELEGSDKPAAGPT